MSSSPTAQSHTDTEEEASSVFLKTSRLHNVLSFIQIPNLLKDSPSDFPLLPLNVLIGANGAGKSNFIEAIALLRACAGDLEATIRKGGGVREWIHKSQPDAIASVGFEVNYRQKGLTLQHHIAFSEQAQRFLLLEENMHLVGKHEPLFYYDPQWDQAHLWVKDHTELVNRRELQNNASILTLRRDPNIYPEITYLAEQYEKIRIYRNRSFGPESVLRNSQRTDWSGSELLEDGSNLFLVLNKFRSYPQIKKQLLQHLQELYEGVVDYGVDIEGVYALLYLTEGSYTIPVSRLSDGTMHYLYLLAILLNPNPGPLICIEEPELGLHPDLHYKIGDLLVEASKRTQLIVTTHSTGIVDAMTDYPENIVVCEKRSGQTHMQRYTKEDLSDWLEEYQYSLGRVWSSGYMGGNRW